MNNEANQFENFKYSQEIKELLNINLSNDDLNNLDHIYNYYDSKNIQRDYEDLIEDIYIFIFKRNLSITQLAEIYKVNQRIIKRWLKELGMDKLLEVEKIKDVSDQRPVYCYENSTFYLPEEMLTRQQMLQIVDFWERRDYAVSMENKQAEEKSKDQNISQEKAIEIAKEYAEKLYGVDCADAVSTIEYDKTQLSVDADASSYYVTLEKETWKYSITVEVDSENGSVNQIDLENKKEEKCAAGVVPDEKFYRKNVKKVLQYFDKLNLKKDISSIRMIYKLKEDGTLNRGNVKYMVRLLNGSAGVVMYSVSTKDLYRFYRISDYKVAMQMEDQACEKQRDRGLVIYNKLIMK